MEIRVPHQLTPDEAARRVRGAAERFELCVPEGSHAGALEGELEKPTPLGAVRARWSASAGELVVVVLERPPFLPAGIVQRALEERLRELLAG